MKLILMILMSFMTLVTIAQEPPLNQVLLQYIELKNNLVAGNANAAKKSAEDLVENLSAQSDKVLSVKEEKGFSSIKEVLITSTKAITSSSDIAKQRAAFGTLSLHMVELAKSVPLMNGLLYVDYCPMKKAYWLSTEKTIRNPYYGSTMLSCGSIKETIKE